MKDQKNKCLRFLKGGRLQESKTRKLCPEDWVCKLIRSLADKHSPSGSLASFINYFFANSRSLNLFLSRTDKEQREMKGAVKVQSRCSPCDSNMLHVQ